MPKIARCQNSFQDTSIIIIIEKYKREKLNNIYYEVRVNICRLKNKNSMQASGRYCAGAADTFWHVNTQAGKVQCNLLYSSHIDIHTTTSIGAFD